jgi:signal transduction histidine kinase
MSLTPLTAEQADMLRIAEVSAEQLLLVIEDILDLTNLEGNKLSLKYQSFSLRNTLEESVEVVLFDAVKKGVEVICDIPPR